MLRRMRRDRPHPEPHDNPAHTVSLDPEVEHAATGELERLVFLSDGVFAIAMTLLAVELALPQVTGRPGDLGQRLLALGPKYFSYALSFVVIASYWRSHQRIFRDVIRIDGRFMWLNLLMLLCIAFLPFPTSVLGTYSDEVAAVTLYAGTLAATGMVVLAMWLYASVGRRLIGNRLSSREIQQSTVRAMVPPTVFALSIGIAQFNTSAAMYAWLSIIVVMQIASLVGRGAQQ